MTGHKIKKGKGEDLKSENKDNADLEEDLKEDLETIRVSEVSEKPKEEEAEITEEEKTIDLGFAKYILFGTVIIILIGAGLLIGSFALKYFLGPAENPIDDEYTTYNNFTFEKSGVLWKTEALLGDTIYEIPFRYHPKDVENISLNGNLGFLNKWNYVYVTFDPDKHNKNVAMANAQVIMKLKFNFNKSPLAGVTVNEQKYIDAGAKYVTCENTTLPVIYLNQDDVSPSVDVNGSCITVSGKDEDLIRAADRLMYGVFGII